MLFRFSLYGFLKNQRYYEPFLILALLEKGLSFFMIGLLISFRELCVNLFEIPTGAIADLYGRRHCMIFSFIAYIVSFVIFATSSTLWLLFAAMFFFGIGAAFKTGTHKAIIFNWLKHENRLDEKTKIYGFTRSWSKMGSALCAVIAAAMVFYSENYSSIFWFCLIPYAANIANFISYPSYLDGERKTDVSIAAVFKHTCETLRECVTNVKLRRFFIESMCYDGLYKTTKDYLQPVLKSFAVALPILLMISDQRRSAIIVGVVYSVLHLGSSFASRGSHKFTEKAGGEDAAAECLWKINLFLFAITCIVLYRELYAVAIVCFVAQAILHNIWRPAMVSRFYTHSNSESGATVLSIESQANSLFTALLAPLLGLCVDQLGFYMVGVLGGVISLVIVVVNRFSRKRIRP